MTAALARPVVAVVGTGVAERAALAALLDGGVAEVVESGSIDPGRSGLPVGGICLLCLDEVDVPLALRLTEYCLRSGAMLIPALVMGGVGQVGPVAEPGRGACLRCADLRMRATTGRTCLAPFGPGNPEVAEHVGREAARRALLPRRVARDLSFHWPSGATSRHRILPTADCPICSASRTQPAWSRPAPRPVRDGPDRPDRILRVGTVLVDPIVGPIRSLERLPPGPDDPDLHQWVATVTDPGWARSGVPAVSCGGNDVHTERARAAALGEAVERMAACEPVAGLTTAAHRDIADEAVDPAAWDLFAPDTRSEPDFPYAPAGPDDVVSWVWAFSLTHERPVRVPASRVFVPFRPRSAADRPDHPMVSGFGAGGTPEQATLAALLEVVERDALMIAWRNRLDLPRLAVDRSSPGGVGDYVAAFADRGIEVRCCCAELDLGAPVVIAMARGSRAGDPAMVVASAAAPDEERACRRALAELAANRRYVRWTMAEAREGRDHGSNGRLYALPENATHLGPWWDGRTIRPIHHDRRHSAAAELRGLVASVAAAGLETLVVDLTPAALRQLGLTVVKVLVPGTYPLDRDARWPHLGGRRMLHAPVTAGLRASPLPRAALNRLPHPLP